MKPKIQVYFNPETFDLINNNKNDSQTASDYINQSMKRFLDDNFNPQILTGTIVKFPPQMINALHNEGFDIERFILQAINNEYRNLNAR
ncbi:hypothetical protein [Moritella viscosa]|uniref:tRNA-specific 2-thiouridylase mnmA n=1 Tax=Moritella viscosa TaxID=80854 RepID=A0A1L0AMG8_9GAMM|nr:hypothetical protein [Moritella viscosa]SGZ17453.1 tRNA-specific 2-thiouridylase mnmA [Moritella viscosa]